MTFSYSNTNNAVYVAVTHMAPKLRHALDDMQISRVKRMAVTEHDNASNVTPNLQHTMITAVSVFV